LKIILDQGSRSDTDESQMTNSTKGRKDLIVLGVDPGSMVTGYGLIKLVASEANLSSHQKSILVDFGVIRTDSKKSLPEKLKQIFEGLSQIIAKKHPDELAIEETFYSKNAKSALVMGQARGVAILAAACAKISVWEYSPREVKCSIVGRGNASKHQVQFMVKNLLGLNDLPQPEDSADALAVALCHAQKIKCTLSPGGRG
jgi:crossover junction endodeoxyribonuclease RuvC